MWVLAGSKRQGNVPEKRSRYSAPRFAISGSYTETKDDNGFANGYDANYNERTFDSAGIYVMQIQN